MSNKSVYYHLFSKTDSPCRIVMGGLRNTKGSWFCLKCLTRKNPPKTIDVHIEENVPRNPPMNWIHECGLGLITKDLLQQIGRGPVSRDLYLGKLYGPNGIIKEWATFRGKRTLIVRGKEHASHSRCRECGRWKYFAMGKPYLYPPPPEDEDIFESSYIGLVIREKLFARLNPETLRRLYVDKLALPKEPADGFGVLD